MKKKINNSNNILLVGRYLLFKPMLLMFVFCIYARVHRNENPTNEAGAVLHIHTHLYICKYNGNYTHTHTQTLHLKFMSYAKKSPVSFYIAVFA